MAISPDGQWLATASYDKIVGISDARTGRERVRLERQDRVSAVAISSDGHWLVTASADKTPRIWDAHTGREYLRLELEDTVKTVAFMRDGQLLAVTHGNLVTLEPWRTEDLVDELCARMTRNLTLADWGQYLGREQYHRICPAPATSRAATN